jgi:hypothetical protein
MTCSISVVFPLPDQPANPKTRIAPANSTASCLLDTGRAL